MFTAFLLIGLMGVGFMLGLVVPSKALLLRIISKCTTVLVILLLFTLGLGLGVDEALIAALGKLGVQSVVIAVLCVGGSVAMGWLFAKHLHRGEVERSRSRGGELKALAGSATYLLVFAIGVVAGVLLGERPELLERYDVTTYLLYGLMLVVGFSVGSDRASLAAIRSMSAKMLLLPVVTIVGTFIGGLVAYLLLREFTVSEVSAIGAGYGYYSLSSVLIGETVESAARGAMLGSIALISNICREVMSILLAGPLARWLGPLAPICSAGATSMDTVLPFVVRASGREYAVVSVYHGVMLTVLCPILVGFFLLF